MKIFKKDYMGLSLIDKWRLKRLIKKVEKNNK